MTTASPTTAPRAGSRPTLLALLLAAGAALVLLLPAAPAQAHSALVSSTPSDGASMSEVPTEIVLEFNEDIEPLGTEVVVLDPEGTPIAEGELTVDGPLVTQPVGFGGAGVHTVTWRAVSADGHPITGEFTYTVNAPTTQSPDTTEATDEATSEDVTTEETEVETSADTVSETGDAAEEDSGTDAAPWWVLGIAAVVGVVVVALVVRRIRARER